MHQKLILILCCMIISTDSLFSQKTEATDPKWWKEAIIYQIYPRSFQDSNGDGIGDLNGIVQKLDYVKSLGVDAVWLNPIYSSPNDDNGYDISDYSNIMSEFGTMKDFEVLTQEMHKRGLKLIMDLVVNHSSDEHEWFKQSRSSRDNKYRDYYHWWPAEKGKPPYRYSLFDVNHDAWMYDEKTNAYYLHYFSRKQPDLNWENPKLRHEIYEIMKFWVGKGVDGFRMDAFQFVGKDTSFPIFPKGYEEDFIQYYAMQPQVHDYLKEMYEEVYSKYDIMSVAEGAGKNFKDAHEMVDADRKELNMAYAFDVVDLTSKPDYSMLKLKKTFALWDKEFAEKGWVSIFLANHDQARMINRYADPDPKYRAFSGKMLNTLLLTMRGTPYVYYGDELGMINAGFTNISQFEDIQTKNEYEYQKNHGGDAQKFIDKAIETSRDNGRTPMQWNAATNAGFTKAHPWLMVGKTYKEINVALQDRDPNSVLNHFRALTKLRNENKTLVYGQFSLVDQENPNVFAYTRSLEGKNFLILLNFSKDIAETKTGVDVKNFKVLLDSYSEKNSLKSIDKVKLQPYQSMVISY